MADAAPPPADRWAASDPAAARASAPILVTGSHRSGTTWVARMLALAPGVDHPRREPFNPVAGYAMAGLANEWFAYAPAFDQRAAARAVELLRERRVGAIYDRRQPGHWIRPARRGRLVIKDPIAAMSAEWFGQQLGARVVLLVRHPGAFLSSLDRVGWDFDLRSFRAQPELLRGPLAPYRDVVESPPESRVGRIGALWRCIYGVLSIYAERSPGWLVRTHEELSVDPVVGFGDLYRELGLRWSDRVEGVIAAHTGADNPVRASGTQLHQLRRDSRANAAAWTHNMSPDAVATLRSWTEDLAGRWYGSDSWPDRRR